MAKKLRDSKVMRSLLPYFGGKSRVAGQLAEMIPPHAIYVEPFAGAAWVFFAKPPSRTEVLNDRDPELINFWRMVRTHPDELLRQFEFIMPSRAEFRRLRDADLSLMTEPQRAARYYYLQKLSFSGMTRSRSFRCGKARQVNLGLSQLRANINAVSERLGRTLVTEIDACECIQRFDSPDTFFFIDPPYWGLRGYAVAWTDDDFRRLRDTLRGLRGKFMLTLNNTPEVRELFGEFACQPLAMRYFAANARIHAGSRKQTRQELLFHNLDCPTKQGPKG